MKPYLYSRSNTRERERGERPRPPGPAGLWTPVSGRLWCTVALAPIVGTAVAALRIDARHIVSAWRDVAALLHIRHFTTFFGISS